MSWLSLGMVAVVTGGSSRVGQGSGRILQAFYGGFVIGSPLVGHVIDQAGFRVVWVLLAGLAAVAALLCGPAPRLPSARG
jgi:fucose permease